MMPAEVQHDQGHQGDDGQEFVLAAKHAPGRAGVAPVHELEETLDHHLLLAQAEVPQHDQLGQSVQQHDRQSDRRDPSFRCPKHEML